MGSKDSLPDNSYFAPSTNSLSFPLAGEGLGVRGDTRAPKPQGKRRAIFIMGGKAHE